MYFCRKSFRKWLYPLDASTNFSEPTGASCSRSTPLSPTISIPQPPRFWSPSTPWTYPFGATASSRGISGATATFADIDTERRAEELLGLEFRIEEPEAEEDDEFYLEDLIGFAVVAEEAGKEEKVSGTVSDYYDSDANPLFELEIDGRSVLVPAVGEFIAHIDFEGRTMHLVLPEGLLTLE